MSDTRVSREEALEAIDRIYAARARLVRAIDYMERRYPKAWAEALRAADLPEADATDETLRRHGLKPENWRG